MAKGKTLRRVRKPQKKIYRGGQQQSLDYKDIQDVYASNLEKKKELYETIKKNGSQIYDVETSTKTESMLEQVRIIVSFLNDFHSSKLTDFQLISDEVANSLEKYGKRYTSYFIPSLKLFQIYINDAEELVSAAKQIQLDFINKKIHIHLIQSKIQLLETLKLSTNSIQKNIESLKETIQTIFKTLESQKLKDTEKEKAITLETEAKKLELVSSIDIVKREYPEGFIPKESQFIQGCPLGTVLENNVCNYYNDTTLLESVPLQEKIINSDTSEWIVWFNNITPSNVNDPIVFKRKPLQYLIKLSNEDSKYFNAKYVVCEQNGALYKDPNGFYIFVDSIFETPLNIPGFSKYYIDYDNLPQAVQIVNNEAPKLRTDMNTSKYYCALHDIDQIISGIQYIETDKDGKYNEIIPFYPVYMNFIKKEDKYTKVSSNNIDTITYYFIKKIDVQIENLILKTTFNTLTFDPYSSNLIDTLYKNKFIDISITKYFNPFVFPQFFVEIGDYFLVQNSGAIPIIFNISLESSEKRMVLYPKQICCFVYSKNEYGYLALDRFISVQAHSSKVAKYKNTYVFVENSKPLYDSEHHLITVPNFNETTKTYYEYDDVFETTPKQISEIVNIVIPEEKISYEFYSYTSPYVTLCSEGNIFVYCDENNNPLYDVLGYFIPVPSPIHYDTNKYVYNLLEKQKTIKILPDYVGVVSIDSFYNYDTQFKSNYFTTVNSIKVYINSSGLPLLANQYAFLGVPDNSDATEKHVQIFLPEQFKIIRIDTNISKQIIQSHMLIALLKIYTQNTQILQNNYKDISGNINNFNSLKGELFNILNRIEVNKDYANLDNYKKEANTIYTQIIESYKNIEKYLIEQKQTSIYNKEVDKIRTSRKAEIELARSKLDKAKNVQNDLTHMYNTLNEKINSSVYILPEEKSNLLEKITKIPLDIQVLDTTYKSLEESYSYINNIIDSAKDSQELLLHEQTINILLKGISSLERNQNSEIVLLKNLNIDIESSELNMRNNEKNKYINLIKQEQFNVDLYKKENIKDSKVLASIEAIETIIKKVEFEEKSTVVPTVESLNKEIEMYKNYIETIIPQEKANILTYIEELNNENDISKSKELVEHRNILIQRINLFNERNEEVNKLLNSLGSRIDEDKKHTFEEELLENYNLVEDIEQNINTNTDIESSIKRVDEIDALNKKILYELQVIELNTQPVAAVVPVPAELTETFVETSALPPQQQPPVQSEQVSVLPVQQQPPVQSEQVSVLPVQQQGGKRKKRQTKKQKHTSSKTTRKLFVGK
jgi:hypothetical protein